MLSTGVLKQWMDGWLMLMAIGVLDSRDPNALTREASVIVDHGRPTPGDEPALLKSSRTLRYEDAVTLWFQLKRCGWTVAEAAW